MKYLIIFLAILSISLVASLVNYVSNSAKLEYEITSLRAHLDTQNKVIETLKLDSEAYHKGLDSANATIQDKYKGADSFKDCNAELSDIKRALDIFRQR